VGEEKYIQGWWWDHIKMYFGETEWDKWIGFIWLRIGTCGWLL
jgi:hypothetical protein